MSWTSLYFLAHSARGKLSKEAARPDYDLRLLVGLANMLDLLMIDLANAEQEQERWFNQSVSHAKEEAPSHEWAETIPEEPEADLEAEDAERDDESEIDEDEMKEDSTTITNTDEGEEDSDDEDNYEDLIRTVSRHSPPDFSSNSDSESEDEHMPPSQPQPTIAAFTEKQRAAIATTSFYNVKETSLSPAEQESFGRTRRLLPAIETKTGYNRCLLEQVGRLASTNLWRLMTERS